MSDALAQTVAREIFHGASRADCAGCRADAALNELARCAEAVETCRSALERICDEFGRADNPEAFASDCKNDPVPRIALAALAALEELR